MFEFSEELKKYFARRDRATAGLNKCESYLSPSELEDMDCKLLESEAYEERGDEYAFHVYEKGGKRYVSIEVYEDREGGMYHQVMYSEDGLPPV